jgi:hypothetical protein
VIIKNNGTGAEVKVNTSSNGAYTIPSLGAGTYTLTVEAAGFKKALVQDVKIDAGVPATANVTMEIGEATESVVVQGGAEVLQTQSANVATTIVGRQITELPFTSRDALDLVLLLPGTSTSGRPRQSSVNGLPKGALNISMDGVNVQDNVLKSNDGFFTYVRPRIDAIDEVTLSTSTPGAESSSEGSVQIKFVTRGGTNELHGSVYEYHRNPALNANYFFNNRDRAPDPSTGRAPRDRVLLNQYGFRVGGPIRIPKLYDGRDKAFFFVNYEEYRLPEQFTRTRVILTPDAEKGIFKYSLTTNGVTNQYQVNLLQIAGTTPNCAACTTTMDPTVRQLLSDIRSSTSQGAVAPRTDPNFQDFTFTNTGGQTRYFPTVRLDFNLTEKHHLENIWNYQFFTGKVDFLNNTDPAFPGFPNQGFQGSNRFSNVTALRSTLTPTITNEARFGLTGGTVLFFPNINPGQFTNQNGFAIGSTVGSATTGFGLAGLANPTVNRAPSRRNAPVKQFSDNVSWARGSHNLNFGANFSQINFWSSAFNGGVVPTITFGLDSTDPANAIFKPESNNFPIGPDGKPAIPGGTDLTRAQNLYSILTGRVTTIGATSYVDESGSNYNYLGNYIERARMREWGAFAQDSWRYRPNLTINAGLRWEVQGPFVALNNAYAKTTYAELFGVSGVGNLFKPNTMTGKVPEFTLFQKGDKTFDTDYNNFAPSLGVAWSPNGNGWLKRVLGEGGQTVIRGGYSIAFVREGMNVVSSILGGNPGGQVDATRSAGNGNLGATPVLFRNPASLGPPSNVPSGPAYPLQGTATSTANGFITDLKLGYVQSYTFGIQREINKDTVIEVRYVGNHGVKMWRQYSLNEINLIENGFLNEFKLAQANLTANIAAGKGSTFAYTGAPGTSPLPTILGYFGGSTAANDLKAYTPKAVADLFSNTTFTNLLFLNNADPNNFAFNLFNNATRRQNANNAGIAANFFVVNPNKLGTTAGSGAFLVDNGNWTKYNSLTVELRRRLSKGLLVQGSYSFAKAQTNYYASSAAVAKNYVTLRNPSLDDSVSPFDIRHALKFNWLYELPIGKGKTFFGNAGGVVDRLVGGWEFHGTARIQSGSTFSLGNVQLVGMTRDDLQKSIKIRQDDTGKKTFFLPQDIVDNTIKAFSVNASGFANGAPTGRYIAPSSDSNCVQAFAGQCGFSNLVLYGPMFTKFDLSVVKRVRISERVNFEFRAEFLNAFNNINFLVGSAAADINSTAAGSTVNAPTSLTFGQTRNAYQDTSTTNDPGGRLIQFVGRINF